MRCLQTNSGTRKVRTGNEKALWIREKAPEGRQHWRKGHRGSLAQMHIGIPVLAEKGNEPSTTADTKSNLLIFFGLSTLSIQIRCVCAKADSVLTHSWASATTPDASALKKITYPGTNNFSELVYNGTGQLVKIVETTSGSVTSTKQLIWCGNRICEERDASGAVVAKFLPFGERVGSTNYFYEKDHLGSIVGVVNSSGAEVTSIRYDAWGKPTIFGTYTPAFGFCGMYLHQRSGLNLTLFRAYSGNLGRWLSRDPVGEAVGANLYGYTENNPISFVDPLGLDGTVSIYQVPGHTFVEVIDSSGASTAVGFYPQPNPQMPDNPKGLQKLESLFQNEPGMIMTEDTKGLTPLRSTSIPDADVIRTLDYIKQQRDLADANKKNYNLFSQCESFAGGVEDVAVKNLPPWQKPGLRNLR